MKIDLYRDRIGFRCMECLNSCGDIVIQFGLEGWNCKSCASIKINAIFKELIRIAGELDNIGCAKLSHASLYHLDGKILEE